MGQNSELCVCRSGGTHTHIHTRSGSEFCTLRGPHLFAHALTHTHLHARTHMHNAQVAVLRLKLSAAAETVQQLQDNQAALQVRLLVAVVACEVSGGCSCL